MHLGTQAKGWAPRTVYRCLAGGRYAPAGVRGAATTQGECARGPHSPLERPVTFEARPGQEEILSASEAVVVVLGGAGTGKTTVAAAAVRRLIDAAKQAPGEPERALFLSFSRAA